MDLFQFNSNKNSAKMAKNIKTLTCAQIEKSGF